MGLASIAMLCLVVHQGSIITEYDRVLEEGDLAGALRLTYRDGWPDESARLQFRARVLAAQGRQEEADRLFWQAIPPLYTEFSKQELDAMRRAKLEDPLTVIERAASKRRFMLVSEAHHVPAHRALGTSLLLPLRKLGFTTLFLETKYQSTLDAAMRSGIVTPGTDRFAFDPARATMIREALRLGYRLVAIDPRPPELERELNMATIIHREMAAHPNERAIVWAGYAHVHKKGNYGRKMMAQWLWELTGDEPYSVYQYSKADAPEPLSLRNLFWASGRSIPRPMALELPASGTSIEHRDLRFRGVDCGILYPETSPKSARRPTRSP